MGFSIHSIGNFISDNVKSAVNDGAHLAQQYINNPVTNAVAPIAFAYIGVPPEVYDVVKNLQNSGLNSLQDIKKATEGGEYSEQIQNLNEDDFKAIQKKIEDEKKLEEQKKKDEKKKKLFIIIGGALFVITASFVTYKLLNKKK